MDEDSFGCLIFVLVLFVTAVVFISILNIQPQPSDAEIRCDVDNGTWLPESKECYFGQGISD